VKYRYPLSSSLGERAASFEEFANGGAQCHARLNDGSVHEGLLISNSMAVIAMRGHTELPFPVDAIAELFQSDDDKNPRQRDEWQFFDKW
jgi:hypothetical protein